MNMKKKEVLKIDKYLNNSGVVKNEFVSKLLLDEESSFSRNNEWPKITIVTPSYNSSKFLEKAILSVLNQNYPNLEYIIIDGGSSDESVEIIKKYEKHLFYWISEKDKGQTQALNKGFSRSTGHILGWLNSDEEYLPETLSKVGKAFIENKELDMYFGNRIKMDVNRKYVGNTIVPAMHPKHYMLYSNRLLLSDATFWNRSIHKLTGKLDEEHYPHLAMDYDWLLRLSVNVKEWKCAETYLSLFTEHKKRKTTRADRKETSGMYSRNKVARELGLSRIQLLLYWLFYGIIRRCKTDGVKGLLWKPRISTVVNIVGLGD